MPLSASERRRLVADGVKSTDLHADQQKFQRPRENAFSVLPSPPPEGPPKVDPELNLGVTVHRQPKVDGPPKVIKGPSTQGSPSTHTGPSTQGSQLDTTPQESIALSALQWKVFQHLKELFRSSHETSHAHVAALLGESKSSVDKATNKLRAFGLIDFKRERRADFQGYRLAMVADTPIHIGSKSEVFRPNKSKASLGGPSTLGGLSSLGGPSRMYVCKKNTYIQAEDLKALLQAAPPNWQIREQTLIQVADLLPTMTALEFRLSLQRLAEQAQSGKQEIKNPNAWLKAAFEKNGGPLVTEREIEARLGQGEKTAPKQPQAAKSQEDGDMAVLRRYLAARPEERVEIDQRAEEHARPLLAATGADKHAAIMEQARLEATQQYFEPG